ncbi:MAG: helix-turn-helix transcriptional regulator [Chthonomonas sp.]|nr:helix-turn-helix transcriptional regulator [Chthonomonas sp.]
MDEALKIFQALSDSTRLAVFQCIRGCGGETAYDTETGCCDATEPGAVALCDVKCQVPCSPSTLTHHLNVLRDAGIIETDRRGRQVYVQINGAALAKVASFLVNTK